ncbi:MAG TPA: type II toxin-antitoxin system MqsA family antitoxin [Bryobacteraceae bacterium]|jgi:putative transcriptional regulator
MKKPTKKKSKAKARTTAFGQSILRGVEEAIQYARGEDPGVKVHSFSIPQVDVKQVRERMQLTQIEFAERFGFPIATLRNWEQGRRDPELSARILLAVIAKRPDVIEEILAR